MAKRGLFRDKRGDYNITELVIFVVLNLTFFVVMLAFVGRASNGAVVYEQVYAKELALMIDEAKPGMDILIDSTKAVEMIKSNQKEKEYLDSNAVLEGAFSISEEKHSVVVKLTSRGGYSFRYFSDYDVKIEPYAGKIRVSVMEKSAA